LDKSSNINAKSRGSAVSKAGVQKAPQSGNQLAVEPIAMPFRAGDVICGKYEILKLIGTGGMGFVVAANHIELGEKVALKFLRTDCLANQELVGRFSREARASVKIKSEYVARVFDVGSLPNGAPFIVMEYLEGKDLYELVHENGPIAIKTAVEYMMQACEALAVAHASGIVHRDVKPENLFLTKRATGMDIIKVLDFGISKVALTGNVFESSMPLVKTMMPMGSPVYMSPEQIRASSDIDPRTDIWSLGCVLYELLTAHAPFEAPSITLLTATILEQVAPLLRSQRPDAPAELEAIVAKCLEKDPNRRYQDVGELAIALYPFAPSRARLSAERCCYVLRSAGLSQATLELSSIHPPSMDSSDVGVTLPGKVATRTTGPSAVSMKGTQLQGQNRSKLYMGALALALVATGAVAFLRQRAPAPVAAAASPAIQAPPAAAPALPANGVPAAAVETANPNTVQAIVPGAMPSAALSAAGAANKSKSNKTKDKDKDKPALSPPAATPKPGAAPSHEVDVGF
jgi:serine/threonine-protein kinase